MIYSQFCNISSSTIRDSSRCCESLVDVDNVEWESHDKLGVSPISWWNDIKGETCRLFNRMIQTNKLLMKTPGQTLNIVRSVLPNHSAVSSSAYMILFTSSVSPKHNLRTCCHTFQT